MIAKGTQHATDQQIPTRPTAMIALDEISKIPIRMKNADWTLTYLPNLGNKERREGDHREEQ